MPRANEFLEAAARGIASLSRETLRLHWVSTENLGAWPVVRKRLDDAMAARSSAPLTNHTDPRHVFSPYTESNLDSADSYFVHFAEQLMTASKVGWSADQPAHLHWDGGEYSWPLTEQPGEDDDAILFPRRFATDEDATRMSSLAELAALSDGAPHWGVLRGDVDQFDVRLRNANSIEEHIHLSVLLKKLIAGELAFLCTLPEFWRRVTLLYRGGDDFAVVGSWDALIGFAREVHRVYETFVEANLHAIAGVEGKTMSLALAIAPDLDTPLEAVFEEAGTNLRTVKASEPGTLHLFGRTLEWKRLEDAEELKAGLVRMVRDFGYSPDYIHDLGSVYRESLLLAAARRGRGGRVEKPWRTHMRVSRVLPQGRSKEFANLRNTVITHLLGRKTTGMKLRPSARVGLEWARLAAGN